VTEGPQNVVASEISYCPYVAVYRHFKLVGGVEVFDDGHLEKLVESYIKEGASRESDFICFLTSFARKFWHQRVVFNQAGETDLTGLVKKQQEIAASEASSRVVVDGLIEEPSGILSVSYCDVLGFYRIRQPDSRLYLLDAEMMAADLVRLRSEGSVRYADFMEGVTRLVRETPHCRLSLGEGGDVQVVSLPRLVLEEASEG